MAPESVLGHLDGDLVGPRAGEFDLGNSRLGGEVVAHPLGDRLEGELVGLTRHGDVHDPEPRQQLGDDGFLGFLRERLDGIDVGLDVVEHAPRVAAEGDLDHHRAGAFVRRGDDLLDAVDALNRLLDADADALLDLFRRRAEVRHLDAHHVELDLGEGLAPDVEHPDQPGDDDEQHQQVGGHRVAREPLDHSVHRVSAFTPVPSWTSPAAAVSAARFRCRCGTGGSTCAGRATRPRPPSRRASTRRAG